MSVNSNFLFFDKHNICTKEIADLNWSFFHPLEFDHNLPTCFTVNQTTNDDRLIIFVTHHPCTNNFAHSNLYIRTGEEIYPIEWNETSEELNGDSPLECKVCVRQYSDEVEELTPRFLTSCGHTICEDCVNKMKQESTILCPFDRKATPIPNGIAKSLPKNFGLIEVLQERCKAEASEAVTSTSSDLIDIPCFENSSHEATFYCVQCEAELCQRCFAETHKAKLFSAHQKLPVAEKPIKLPKCETHPYNNAEFLCKDEKCENPTKLMCHTCILTDEHKSHDYDLLMDHLKINEKSLKQIFEKLGQKVEKEKIELKDLEKRIKSYDQNGAYYKSISKMISDEFDIRKKEVLDFLDATAESICDDIITTKQLIKDDLQLHEELQTEIQTKLKLKNDFGNVDFMVKLGESYCNKENSAGECYLAMEEYTFGLTSEMGLEMNEKA